MTIGQNGIFIKAQNATKKYEEATLNEQNTINQIVDYIDEKFEEYGPKTVSSVKGGEKFNETETIQDDNGKKVTIPKGFSVSEDSNTVVDEGIVITDGTNEFVWVPVDDPNTMFVEETVKLNGVDTATTIYSKLRVREDEIDDYTVGKPGNRNSIREPDVLSSYDTNSNYYKSILGFDSTKEMADSMVEEYKKMSESVKKYNGFYIGRYELTGTVDKPTEKAGNVLVASAGEAKNWYGLYKACQNVIQNNSDVKSTMIYGCQWDETMAWLKNTIFKGQEDKVDKDSSSWGNYNSNHEEPTGSVAKYKVNEIYDLAGNYREWTQEAGSDGYRFNRGGNSLSADANYPASARIINYPDVTNNHYTSRATLYITK